MKLFKKYVLLFGIAGAIIAADQITKFWVKSKLSIGESWTPWTWLEPIARIVNWHNSGAAFGLFQQGGPIFAVLAVIVAIVIIYYYPKVQESEKLVQIALAMQLAGSLGNLIDRLTQGFVTDFISIGNFPVFNVADSSITVGVGFLLLGVWVEERKQKKINDLHSQNSQEARSNEEREQS
jgi:signal peptidase II